MPTLRERTSTSSAAIVGTSRSRTVAVRGSSNTSAFIPAPFSLLDKDLDLVCGAGREARKRVGGVVQRDTAGHDPFDGQAPRTDLRRNAIEVVHPVAPGADDRQVVE